MIYVSLQEVQEAMPERNIYAWHLTYSSELEVYRAVAWIKLDDGRKVAYERYLSVGLVKDKDSLVGLFKKHMDDGVPSVPPPLED